MKKFLLSLAIGAMAVSSVSAATVTDGQTYAPKNGLTCTNLWANDLRHNKAEWTARGMKDWSSARQATVMDGVVYIADSGKTDPEVVDKDGAPLESGRLFKYDLTTGEFLGTQKLYEEDGQTRVTGLLCAYSIGVDAFGHMWIMGFSGGPSPITVRSVDPATGITKIQGKLEKGDGASRTDMGDLIGDVTREQARCGVVYAAAGGTAVYLWVSEQGSQEWIGGIEGDIVSAEIMDFVPANAASFGISPVAKFVPREADDAYNARLFYLDGHGTLPTMYDNTGAIVEGSNFLDVQDEVDSEGHLVHPELSLVPAIGANGIMEFSLAGKNFIGYASTIWTSSNAYQVNIAQVADDYTFTDLDLYWKIPADGLAPSADVDGASKSAVFVQALDRRYVTDANGKEGIQIVTYECKVGCAAYLIAEEGFVDAGVENALVNGAAVNVVDGVVTVSEEASEIAVYAVNGQLVAKANNATELAVEGEGVYVVKVTVNGKQAVKKVVL